jgi:hypothetical protein
LSAEESALYDQLRQNHWGDRIRLEQEKIGFDFLLDALRIFKAIIDSSK